MASSDENPMVETINPNARSSNAGLPAGDASGGQPRRRRSKEAHQEVIDELAQETKRVTLLEREEQQLKGRKHVSRLLFVFGIIDDRKTQQSVEQEFLTWQSEQENGNLVTGLLLFLGQAAVSFLEGPTELLFKALEHFHGLSLDVKEAPPPPAVPENVRASQSSIMTTETAVAASPRAALIGPVRVLYFTELHGVRTSVGWCSFVSSAKLQQTQNNMEDGVHEPVFDMYRKMLILCMKVQRSVGSETSPGPDALQSHYRKVGDFMPLPDEVVALLGKQCAANLFSFVEFQKVFMKPFQLVLNHELLWPMAPPLTY